MVIKKYEKLFESLEPAEPPAGLYEKIILAIEREKNLRKRHRFLFSFFSLLFFSFATMPFSFKLLIEEIKNSGVLYFFSSAIENLSVFLTFWQDFCFAILESLPIFAIVLFLLNLTIFLFTFRLVFSKKRLLVA